VHHPLALELVAECATPCTFDYFHSPRLIQDAAAALPVLDVVRAGTMPATLTKSAKMPLLTPKDCLQDSLRLLHASLAVVLQICLLISRVSLTSTVTTMIPNWCRDYLVQSQFNQPQFHAPSRCNGRMCSLRMARMARIGAAGCLSSNFLRARGNHCLRPRRFQTPEVQTPESRQGVQQYAILLPQ
jgi:hypothetical protein